MLEKFGIFLVSWIVVGMIVATRLIFFNGMFTKKNKERHKKEFKKIGLSESVGVNKAIAFICLTILGYYAFFLDTKNTFSKRKPK